MAAVGEATVRETEGEASEREEVEEEETKERGEEGPRDAIRVRVLAYLNTEETFFYTIEVWSPWQRWWCHGNPVGGC